MKNQSKFLTIVLCVTFLTSCVIIRPGQVGVK